MKPRIRIITPVWGARYIDRWLDMCLASLRSDGNIPYLVEHSDFELAVVTTSVSVAQMQESPRFKFATSGISVRFQWLLVSEHMRRIGYDPVPGLISS